MLSWIKLRFIKKYRIKKHYNAASVINQKQPFYKPFILILPSLLTILLFTLIPFILVIMDAFLIQRNSFNAGNLELSHGNFVKLFGGTFTSDGVTQTYEADKWFVAGIRNSIIYAIVALPISLVISLLISSAIANVLRKKLRGFFQTIFFIPYVTSGIAVSVTFYFLFDTQNGFINQLIDRKIPIPWLTSGETSSFYAFVVILIRGVWGNLAFQVLLLTTAMLSVNPSLYKAASIDGSHKLQQFFSITLPSIKRTVSFLITIGIIGGIKIFPLALFNNNALEGFHNGGSSIMLYIFYFVREDVHLAAAASLVLFVLGVFISFTLRRLVTITYNISINLGVKNVSNKIMNKRKVSKKIFSF
ncbi:carbohydrate ABC transporter permease [Mycoplasma zalophi]|uniref:carbohydrate ABC transporter permease n=1 Tax=Mycoplasma zalophi TaxID=191287 RepID=UPI001FE97400|nr:sugar ABC transporter permease [Mycoplasma zalophi]